MIGRFAIMVMLAGLPASCQIKTAINGAKPKIVEDGSGGGGGGGASGGDDRATASGPDTTATMPDLQGMTQDEAMAALKKAGIEPREVEHDDSLACNDDQTKHGRVCYQSPVPGAQTLSHMSVTLNFQQADPDSTTPGVPGAHYKMPDVMKMKLADARKKLAAAGFSAKDHIEVLIDNGCAKPEIVCGQKPGPGEPTTTEFPKIIYVSDTTIRSDEDMFPEGN